MLRMLLICTNEPIFPLFEYFPIDGIMSIEHNAMLLGIFDVLLVQNNIGMSDFYM